MTKEKLLVSHLGEKCMHMNQFLEIINQESYPTLTTYLYKADAEKVFAM